MSKCSRYTACYGVDHELGRFLQIYDSEFEDDPSGEGLILDFDERFGLSQNFTEYGVSHGGFEEGILVMFMLLTEGGIEFEDSIDWDP
jgi:hypothetical protein